MFLTRLLVTDEACFTRNGILNVHNSHTWAVENPHTTRHTYHQQRFSINVWAGIVGDFLIGPYLLPARLGGSEYLHFLSTVLNQLLEDVPLATRQRMRFMHDGAPAHFSHSVREWLQDQYPRRWIGRGHEAPVVWPPRSPDLNPIDFYLWGHLKGIVYATDVDTQEGPWHRVQDAATLVRNSPGVFERVRSSLLRRANACVGANGSHFENLL